MSDDADVEAEAELESRLTEQEYFRPRRRSSARTSPTPRSTSGSTRTIRSVSRSTPVLEWDEHWDEVLDDSNPPFYEWFTGGKLNASYNCIDRHLDERKNQAAFIWEGTDADEREHITYQDLYNRVNEMAAVLKEVDVEEDDVVTCHLPMLPSLPVTMLSCARISAPTRGVRGLLRAGARGPHRQRRVGRRRHRRRLLPTRRVPEPQGKSATRRSNSRSPTPTPSCCGRATTNSQTTLRSPATTRTCWWTNCSNRTSAGASNRSPVTPRTRCS